VVGVGLRSLSSSFNVRCIGGERVGGAVVRNVVSPFVKLWCGGSTDGSRLSVSLGG